MLTALGRFQCVDKVNRENTTLNLPFFHHKKRTPIKNQIVIYLSTHGNRQIDVTFKGERFW
jgi:hypothetical protein